MAEKQKFNIKDTLLCAIFAAVCCVCSIITVPIGTIPVTLGTFGIMVTALMLDFKKGEISTAVFVMLGAVGLPVFSGMNGGFGVLAGPTGGYIYSYLLMVPLISLFAKKLKKSFKKIALAFLGCLLAIAVCYFIGTIHFMIVMSATGSDINIFKAISLCVLPFIPFDIIKAVVAIIIAVRLKPLIK